MGQALNRFIRTGLCLLFFWITSPLQAAPGNQFILRTPAASRDGVLSRNGLQLLRSVEGVGHDIFLVSGPVGVPPDLLEAQVKSEPEVQDFEPVGDVVIPETSPGLNLNQSTVAILDSITNQALVAYYGDNVRSSYVNQLAGILIHLSDTHRLASGAGIVAVIDTGVDPKHPALSRWLVPGYNFIHNLVGSASEWVDLDQSTIAILDQSTVAILDASHAAVLNQSTVAILDQSTVAILDTTKIPPAFGHGTMVAGVVHLIAPTAQIMPLKAFRADGTSNTFDVIRAIYYAVDHGANVINMSFSLVGNSRELVRAVNYATEHRVICVASVGNAGKDTLTYPAALRNVLGVASTSNLDVRSQFSNYGTSLVTLAAPGEGIVTTYPGAHYAAAWGTSFSTPMVAGAPALLLQNDPTVDFFRGIDFLSHARELTSDLGYGRLDLYQAITRQFKFLGIKF